MPSDSSDKYYIDVYEFLNVPLQFHRYRLPPIGQLFTDSCFSAAILLASAAWTGDNPQMVFSVKKADVNTLQKIFKGEASEPGERELGWSEGYLHAMIRGDGARALVFTNRAGWKLKQYYSGGPRLCERGYKDDGRDIFTVGDEQIKSSSPDIPLNGHGVHLPVDSNDRPIPTHLKHLLERMLVPREIPIVVVEAGKPQSLDDIYFNVDWWRNSDGRIVKRNKKKKGFDPSREPPGKLDEWWDDSEADPDSTPPPSHHWYGQEPRLLLHAVVVTGFFRFSSRKKAGVRTRTLWRISDPAPGGGVGIDTILAGQDIHHRLRVQDQRRPWRGRVFWLTTAELCDWMDHHPSTLYGLRPTEEEADLKGVTRKLVFEEDVEPSYDEIPRY